MIRSLRFWSGCFLVRLSACSLVSGGDSNTSAKAVAAVLRGQWLDQVLSARPDQSRKCYDSAHLPGGMFAPVSRRWCTTARQ